MKTIDDGQNELNGQYKKEKKKKITVHILTIRNAHTHVHTNRRKDIHI